MSREEKKITRLGRRVVLLAVKFAFTEFRFKNYGRILASSQGLDRRITAYLYYTNNL